MSTEPQAQPAGDAALAGALAQLRSQQNLLNGVAAGLVAALLGAAAWAAITVVTKYQIGWMAVGVGFLVGYGVRVFGKGIESRFGIAGAVLALVGCALGNLLAVVGIVAADEEVSFLALLTRLDLAATVRVMVATFGPIDLVFYGIALYEGYKLSFRRVTEADLSASLGGSSRAV